MKTPFAFGALGLMAVMLTMGSVAAQADRDLDEVPLTLTGCVVAGEKDGSYLLTNVIIDGTTLAPADVFYRFNDSDKFEDHVGQRVQVTGTADLEDVDKGQVTTKVEDGVASTEVKSERRSVTVHQRWFGSEGSMKLEADVPTYKFDVDDVRRMAGNCAAAPPVPGAVIP